MTAAFTLLGLLLGLHTTYRRLVETTRPDSLYVNVRFPGATGIEMPITMRHEIARIPDVAAVTAFSGPG